MSNEPTDARPHRVHRSRRPGSRLEPGAVCVTRETKWGNPFTEKEYGRTEALRLYSAWLPTSGLDPTDLAGRNLACWCPLDEPCHADVLLDLANVRQRAVP